MIAGWVDRSVAIGAKLIEHDADAPLQGPGGGKQQQVRGGLCATGRPGAEMRRQGGIAEIGGLAREAEQEPRQDGWNRRVEDDQQLAEREQQERAAHDQADRETASLARSAIQPVVKEPIAKPMAMTNST